MQTFSSGGSFRAAIAISALVAGLAIACDDGSTPGVDSGPAVDAGPVDSGSAIDAGPGADAGLDSGVDSGVLDAGPMDAGDLDSGSADAGPVASLGPARLLAPISGGTVTSRDPTFWWSLGRNTDGARVEICRDRACTMVIATFTGTTSARRGSDLPTGVLFWRVFGRRGTTETTTPSATWAFSVGTLSAPRDTSWGPVLDVNGDGYADAIVGAAGIAPGTAFVFLGGPSGLATTSHRMLGGDPSIGAGFGVEVANAGDLDGDGFGDVAVGDPFADPGGRTNAGTVSIYLGGPLGLSTVPARVLEGAVANANFGLAIAGVGDVDGDGYGDLAVGAPFDSPRGRTGAGVVRIFLGNALGVPATADVTLEGAVASDGLGAAVAGAGDVNADGYDDVLVGAPFADSDAGTALVYLGGASGLSTTPVLVGNGVEAGASFGSSLAGAVDVNGDGYADAVIAASNAGATGSGAVYVHLGSASGLVTSTHRFYAGTEVAEHLGLAVESARDVNGDGYGDVLVSSTASPGGIMYAGRVVVFLGSVAGLPASASRTLDGTSMYQGFGGATAGVGDVDRDGFADILIDASPLSGPGLAALYVGGPTGIGTTPSRTLSGSAVDDGFGMALD